jgi:hypothetical protein
MASREIGKTFSSRDGKSHSVIKRRATAPQPNVEVKKGDAAEATEISKVSTEAIEEKATMAVAKVDDIDDDAEISKEPQSLSQAHPLAQAKEDAATTRKRSREQSSSSESGSDSEGSSADDSSSSNSSGSDSEDDDDEELKKAELELMFEERLKKKQKMEAEAQSRKAVQQCTGGSSGQANSLATSVRSVHDADVLFGPTSKPMTAPKGPTPQGSSSQYTDFLKKVFR